MAKSLPPIFDADGHIFEDLKAIWELMDEPFRHEGRFPGQSMFAPLDHLHNPVGQLPPGSFDIRVKAPEWLQFAEDLGVHGAVLYPTSGLAVGRMVDPEYTVAVCRAYNDWLSRDYLQH